MKQSAGQESAVTASSQVDDNEPLLRLLWAEHDVRDGEILPEAISTSDLRGPERGFSVDREYLARREIMEALIDYQRPRPRTPEDRQTPYLSRIASAKVVRELTDSNGEKPFLVDPSPPGLQTIYPQIQLTQKLSRPRNAQKVARSSGGNFCVAYWGRQLSSSIIGRHH